MNVRAGSLLARPAAVAGGSLSAAPRHWVHPVGPVAQAESVNHLAPVDIPVASATLVSVRTGTLAMCCSRGPGVAPRPAPGSAPCGDWRSRWPEASMTAWQLALTKESRPLSPTASLCPGSISKSRGTAAMSVGLLGMWMGQRLTGILAGQPCRIGWGIIPAGMMP